MVRLKQWFEGGGIALLSWVLVGTLTFSAPLNAGWEPEDDPQVGMFMGWWSHDCRSAYAGKFLTYNSMVAAGVNSYMESNTGFGGCNTIWPNRDFYPTQPCTRTEQLILWGLGAFGLVTKDPITGSLGALGSLKCILEDE